MKKFVLLGCAMLLASCGSKQEAASPEATASDTTSAAATPVAGGGTPGVYDATRPDGTKVVATLNADGTYQRDYGDKVEKGTWVSKGNQTCFDPEGDAAEECRTRGPAAADGSFESTDSKGAVSKVVPRP